MAIFASTTTSGYSDPLKAMSIKALEQRLKDQQAQMAAEKPDAAMMATIPGGIGHVLGQVGDRMAQSRNEQAVAAQKEELARTIAGMDPNNPAPEALSKIAIADPESYRQMLTQLAERRRQQDLFGHQDAAAKERYKQEEIARGQGYTHSDAAAAQKVLDDQVAAAQAAKNAEIARQQGYTHDDAKAAQKVLDDQVAAKEAARVAEITEGQKDTAIRARDAQKRLDDEVAAAANENRIQSRPTDLDVVKADRALARGEINQETRDAIVNKATGPSASEMKAGNELQNTHLDTQSALSDLKEARGLMGPDGTAIRAGTGAGWAQTGAKLGGDKLGITDPTLTQPTERFNQLMSAEAINAMAAKLKGASTDYEMKAFVALMNDPNAEPKTKMQALDKMILKAEAHLALQQEQLKRAKVSAPAGPGGAAAAPAAAGAGGAAAPAPAADVPRPAGKNDSQLIEEAKAALATPGITPAQKAAIDAQLQKWLMGGRM